MNDSKGKVLPPGELASKRAIKRYKEAIADPDRLVVPFGFLAEEVAKDLRMRRESKKESAEQDKEEE